MGFASRLSYGSSVQPQTTGAAPNPFMQGLIETANALQVPPAELAAMISFETGGTLDPMQPGPTTQWGRHRGLIQFGEPQAQQYGVDFSSPEAALASQLGANGAIVKYALAHGFVPGQHSPMDLYSTINAGAPGRYGARDAAAGGTPGTVQEKFEREMAPHRQKVYAMFGADMGGVGPTTDPGWTRHAGGQLNLPANQPGHTGGGTGEGALPEDPEAARREARLAFAADLVKSFAPAQDEPSVVSRLRQSPVNMIQPLAIPEF